MTNVQGEDVTVTVRMRTGVGAYRLNQRVELDPDTAAGLMSAGLADLMPALPAEIVPAELDTEGAADATPARVKSGRESGRRKTARDAVIDGIHDQNDADSAKPVEGADASRSGNSEG